MRKMFKAAASLAVGCAILSTSAFADLTGTPELNDTKDGINVTVSGLGTGESTIMVLKGARTEMPATINDSDIVYINQQTAVDGSATYSMPLGTRVGDATAVTVFAGGTNETAATLLGSVTLNADVPATGIVINENGAAAADTKEMEIGATAAFTAVADPSTTTDTVVWTAKQGDTDVTATVLAIADGTATFTAPTVEADTVYTVTATAGSVSDSIAITVKAAATPGRVKGDVVGSEAGVINAEDYYAVLQMSLGLGTWDDDQLNAADVVGSEAGVINAEDYYAVLQKSLGLSVEFKN